jgi:hypothetical protein
MNFLSSFPDSKTLLAMFPDMEVLNVNSHIHTPYSFSAFKDIPQIFEMARKEEICVLGINDFFVTDGFLDFCHEALKNGIFPLFNIEFIGLLKEQQQEGIRINDPGNPGRCYLCGKGLNYPFQVNDRISARLQRVIEKSQDQVKAMIDKTNNWFDMLHTGIAINYGQIRKHYAKELVRERHIAQAIRISVYEKQVDEQARLNCLTLIFNGKPPASRLNDFPGVENEIRGNLLKAGGKAFVEEDESAFMMLDEIMEIIVHAGGIPCYPVLLDDKNGHYTEFEKYPEMLWKTLTAQHFGCIELIPGRNDAHHLERFVDYFNKKGFILLLGTEHNTPDMIPMTCDTRGRKPISSNLKRISYEGACVVAAHQYLKACGLTGFIDNNGLPRNLEKETFVKLGNAVIRQFLKQFKSADNE